MCVYKRAVAVMMLLFCVFSGLTAHYLTLAENPASAVVEGQSATTLRVGTVRGNIYDRNGRLLVNDTTEWRLCIAPYTRTMSALAETLPQETFSLLSARLESGRPIVTLADDTFPTVRGVLRFCVPRRYGERVYAPHLVGYLGADGNGAVGMEFAYNTLLQSCNGTVNVTYSVNAAGHLLSDVSPTVTNTLVNASAGIMLTIDRDIQQYAEQVALRDLQKGAVLIAAADTAEILASVSVPTFQPSTVATLLDAADAPLMDRTLQNYNCGSIFKIVSAAAALEAGVPITREYTCNGVSVVNGVRFHCHNRLGHGALNMEHAFALSCNCYFIQLIQDVGAEAMYRTATALGFDRAVIPTENYKTARATIPSLKELKASDAALANLSFGQGALLATPYHMIQTLSAVVNGGELHRPTVVRGTVGVDMSVKAYGITPTQTAFSRETAKKLQQLMVAAVKEGATGEKAMPASGGAGGKTGTAESGWITDSGEMVQNWFVGYYPAENPRYLVAVLAEDSNTTKASAAEVFCCLCDGLYALGKEK